MPFPSPTASLGFGSTAILGRTTRSWLPTTCLPGIQFSRAIRCRYLTFGWRPTWCLIHFSFTVSYWALDPVWSNNSSAEFRCRHSAFVLGRLTTNMSQRIIEPRLQRPTPVTFILDQFGVETFRKKFLTSSKIRNIVSHKVSHFV